MSTWDGGVERRDDKGTWKAERRNVTRVQRTVRSLRTSRQGKHFRTVGFCRLDEDLYFV